MKGKHELICTRLQKQIYSMQLIWTKLLARPITALLTGAGNWMALQQDWRKESQAFHTRKVLLRFETLCVCWAAQLCPILCKPLDCSPPGFSVHGIFQARILECVAVSFSRGSPRLRDQILISCVSRIAGRFFTCWANFGGSLGSNKFWCEWEVKELWKSLNTINSCIWEKADDFLKAFACRMKVQQMRSCVVPWKYLWALQKCNLCSFGFYILSETIEFRKLYKVILEKSSVW